MKLQQAAFGGSAPLLKGGLHCHTTRSDGRGTPEEVLRLHAQNGYDFLAITDHRRYNRTDFAPDAGVLVVPGMEFDAIIENDHGFRCFHTVCIGPDDATNPFEHDQQFERGEATNQDEYQPYLDWLHDAHQLTVYCHPQWSSTPTRYFDRMKGDFAMEIWNSGCAIENEMDTNAAYWDEMLGLGHRIFGVATDDGHAIKQHCNGWVMVRAEKTVPAILDALANGRFYSSCGPVIRDFYVEDGVAHLFADPCSRISFLSDCHPTRIFRDELSGLTHAELDLKGNYRYIRAAVMDAQGRRAWTNPIFLD